jgi:hypothetical protein
MSYYNITLSSSASTSVLPFLLVNGRIYNGAYNTVYNGTYDAISGLLMETVPVGSQKGYGMLANSTSSMTTTFYNTYASAGARFLLEPNNPIQNSSITVQSSYVTITNPTCTYTDTTNSLIYYSPLYFGNGPVSYENWPEQYKQQYTFIYPDAHELVSGNVRIQGVSINGLDGTGTIVDSNQQKNVTLNSQNFQNLCINDCGYIAVQTSVINVSGTLRMPLYLSGLTNASSNTITLNVPFSYNINVENGVYKWPNNNKPTTIIQLTFDRSMLYTHRMILQGHISSGQDWNNLNTAGPSPSGNPANGWSVDLRTINDLFMFIRSSSFSLFTFLYPQTSTTSTIDVNNSNILNVNYVIPLSAFPS